MSKRDERGRFQSGASGNPKGRPLLAISELARKLLSVVRGGGSKSEAELILEKAIELAKLGDKDSRTFVFDRAFGKPPVAVVQTGELEIDVVEDPASLSNAASLAAARVECAEAMAESADLLGGRGAPGGQDSNAAPGGDDALAEVHPEGPG